MESLRRSMDSLQLTSQSSHNHGEEQRKLTQRTDSRTQNGNGLALLKNRRKTLETMESKKQFTDSHPTTNLFSHNHGEEPLKHTHLMVSRTHLGNGSMVPNHLLKLIRP